VEPVLGGTDCELLRVGELLAQPVNALSSLAYVVAGLWVIRRRRWLGASVVAVGIGSVLYHGPQPPGIRLVHDLTIVGALAGVAAIAWRRLADRPVPPPAAGLAVAGLVFYVAGRTDGPFCDPGSLLQAHAAWHVLTAAAFAVLGRAGGPLPSPRRPESLPGPDRPAAG
jgi:hypothetical protein